MMPRKRMVVLGTLLVVVLLLLVFNWSFVRRLPLSTMDAFYVSTIARKASATENFTPVAKDLAVLSTFANGVIHSVHAPNNWKPESIAGLNPLYWHAGPDGASVVFTSVLSRFYYRLERDEQASTGEEKVWNLLLKHAYGSKHLERVTVTESDRPHFNGLVEEIIAAYDERIADDPQSVELFRNKIVFLLLAGFHEAALAACQQVRQLSPQTGWFALAEATLLAADEGKAAGYDLLRDWADNHRGLDQHFWLAFFCSEEQLDDEFDLAMTEACDFIPSDPNSDARELVFPMVVLACSKQRDDLAILMCKKAGSVPEKDELYSQDDAHHRHLSKLQRILLDSGRSEFRFVVWDYCRDREIEFDKYYGYMDSFPPTRIAVGKRSILLSMEDILQELSLVIEKFNLEMAK